MQPTNIKIKTLEKEIENLRALHKEAEKDHRYFEEEVAYFNKKAKEAKKRMLDLDDEIQYRLAEITELEEQVNEQVPGSTTSESA